MIKEAYRFSLFEIYSGKYLDLLSVLCPIQHINNRAGDNAQRLTKRIICR